MKKLVGFLILIIVFYCSAYSQLPSNQYFTKEIPEKANKEFQFIGYYINQGVMSNIYPKNDFLKGQVVGRLFGGNTTVTSNEYTSKYVEQRLIPFFIYTPHLFNGKATLRASFELDWTWGDAAYGVGGNFGGAFSADQVNLQTQNLELELNPSKGYYINLGLQRIFDTPYNPYKTMFDKMTTTGYRLAYFGTDGVGVSARKDWDFARVKAGYYKLYENYIQLDDDVSLFELTGEKDITRTWKWGGSAYYLRDRASGAGGVSILSQGLNSLLATHNGMYKFGFGDVKYRADIGWIGTFFSRNAEQYIDPWTVSGFVNFNIGKADTLKNKQVSDKEWIKATDIFGYAANLRTSYRYGQTPNDNITLDILYSSGDKNGITDGKYNGVITGNQWGAPGAIFISSGAYLLMPHGNVINRYTPAVMDISNIGYGMSAATLNFSHGIIPNKLNAKIGTAAALSNVQPAGGGKLIGTEFNGNIQYNFGPYMSLELHGAYLMLGDFYDSRDWSYGSAVNGGIDGRPENPWTAFLVFKWLMF
ncbi:conserved hypothetical protein [uncultured Paludibacter sp.]|uniref:Alginate export domain-containing protein n=1 Tax=uncultured Paludibacter sp. TaxID=497635 RepID=A0A653A5W1_9BACT|nr:conserved hypothetical protein [uncultured Paludibacter sp.]